MVLMAKITKFYLDKASYSVGNDKTDAMLVVDYKNNMFSYSGKMKNEVDKVAKDLLQRKHGVNFADKIRVY